MKKIVLLFIFGITVGVIGKAQTTRYFEFSTTCGHGNWQDSSFIAATTNQTLIDTVLANIARPLNERKFIAGPIDYGNGGHNHNASHWFLWHFIPNQWNLAEVAIEVCDGCPYTDVDADTAYWVGNILQYCPWSGRPMREVSSPSGMNETTFENEISTYPNPANDQVTLHWNTLYPITVTMYNAIGQEVASALVSKQNAWIDISKLEKGLYLLKMSSGNKIGIKKIMVAEK